MFHVDTPFVSYKSSTSAASSTEMLGNSVSPNAEQDMVQLPQPKHPVMLTFTQGVMKLGGRRLTNSSHAKPGSNIISLAI